MVQLTRSRPRPIPHPAAGVWPLLFDRVDAPVHAWAARTLTRAAVARLPLSMTFPDGTTWGAGGPRLQLIDPGAFFARLGRDGLIGFGESWMTGEMTSGDWYPRGPARSADEVNTATDELAAVLTVLAGRLADLVPAWMQRLRLLWQHRAPAAEDNTVSGSRRNIHRHYDLSNELFELFLDETMTYSAAWFEPGEDPHADLNHAQLRKIDGILDLARVRPGQRVLEIGSGWGSLAIRAAAERGATVTTLTVSEEQYRLARDRIGRAGLSDRVEVRLEDYRVHAQAHHGRYDAVVSVEMIEAVGERYWPAYFCAVDRMLARGGRLGLQAITIAHDRMLATRHSYTWVHKYVFPGGVLPSVQAIQGSLAATTGLRIVEARRLGHSYALTLQEWRHRFNRACHRVCDLGFDATFLRMWNFYLAYSQAGFASDYLDDWQLGIGRG